MKLLRKIVGLIFIALVVVAALNYQTIFDFVRGKIYVPSPDMASIRTKLDLTSRGEFLFNASRPELNNEEDFNKNCQSYNEEDTILGCYTLQSIFVYDIKEKELDGIVELTTAHELLHAVYERMSGAEKDSLRELLEKTYADNKEILAEEIESYNSEEQLEEIYVRVGTEVKSLPEKLEEHYAEIFKDQDKVVDFYEGYAGVFRKLEKEIETLETELKNLDGEINAKITEYESGIKRLNSEIDEFNNCANTAGCFSSDWEFYNKRNVLVAEQQRLEASYDEIDGLINRYNSGVDRFNNNIVRSEKLQNIINSHVKVKGLGE